MIKGVKVDNHYSDYHDWPINKNERKFRFKKNYKEFSDFFEKLLTQFSISDQEILKIDFNKQIEKANLKYAFNKVKKRNDFKKLKYGI